IEGVAVFEGTDGGEGGALGAQELAADAEDVIAGDGVDALHDLVDGEDLAEEELLRADPAGDGARVLHTQLDAAARHLLAFVELLVREFAEEVGGGGEGELDR